MATSHQMPRNPTRVPEDDSQDDAAIITKTTIGIPSCGDILSTPPRINRVFGLVTPDSPSQRNSCQFGSTSPPRTPTRSRGVPKDTKSPTFTGNPSERSSGPGLVTPDHTPPRDSKARPIPIRRREETKDKSELSRSLETTSNIVLEVLETFQHQAEDIPYTGKPGQSKTLCSGITKKTCTEPAKAPNHHEQHTSPPASTSSVGVRGPQRRQSKDTAANPTTDVNSKLCGQLTRLGNPCKIRLKPPAQYCRHHWQPASHNTPTSPTTPNTTAKPATDVNLKLCGQLARFGNLRVEPPAQYYRRHWQSANHDTPTSPTTPNTTAKPTTDVNSKLCGQLTRLGNPCKMRVKLPAQYCCHHWQPASHNTPTSPTTPNTIANQRQM
ncbi:uncharacterized protein EDB91DRAFT_822542 [Suillus paluster]|uniref:uncharacterized protein n=1 Tax=Suillus paluster TaxID=48578 RepID=UPI001B876B49|nr:uncharacterized protein EDB91DRAFT_822542 [Suillus paluster]KAG1748921.1 hypothetical protein EDB91DRAFT_822542 [Suillus paluster]